MPKDYQPIKDNKYILKDTVYNVAVAIIRNYENRKEQYQNLLTDDIAIGYVKATASLNVTDNTQRVGSLRAEIAREIDATDRALSMIPPVYRQGILQKIKFPRSGYPNDAHRNTYANWKRYFIFTVAQNLGLI